jgi:hypothetical protein
VFSTQEVLEIAQAAEAETSKKKASKRPRKHGIQEMIEGEEDRELEMISSDSDSDCIVVTLRK